jgi:hypothetical protein
LYAVDAFRHTSARLHYKLLSCLSTVCDGTRSMRCVHNAALSPQQTNCTRCRGRVPLTLLISVDRLCMEGMCNARNRVWQRACMCSRRSHMYHSTPFCVPHALLCGMQGWLPRIVKLGARALSTTAARLARHGDQFAADSMQP